MIVSHQKQPNALIDEISQKFPSYQDAPIHSEEFSQWVLEDNFAASMPDFSHTDVEITDNVEPFEEAKIRILNGGHSGLCYLGALYKLTTFDEAMAHSEARAHFEAWEREILQGLGTDFPFDLSDYVSKVTHRFENAGIADQLERICMDGYSKMAIYIRPTLRACLKAGITPHAGYNAIAAWVVYARQFKQGLTHIPYHDPLWEKFAEALDGGKEEHIATDANLWGDLPSQFDGFVSDVIEAIKRMQEKWQD